MKPKAKKILKVTGIIVGVIILIAVAFGLYVNSIIPKPMGKPVSLQSEIFKAPSNPYPMEGKYIYKSATELEAMLRNHEATAIEIMTEYLNNIKNNNYKYNSLIWIREEEALQEAKRADDMIARGDTVNMPLLGIPITIKEMFWVKGSPSTLNAKMFGFIAPRDAEVVKHLKDAGAIILGTTNVSFMLADYQTQGEVYPTGNNPYDVSRTPGGSTGGGAAALAAGFSSIELGSDLGGSIRIPAAFCGLYGLKPTIGAVNITDGTNPDTTTAYSRFALASAGPLARTVDDLQLIWEVLKTTKQDDRFQKPIHWTPGSNKQINEYHIAWMDEWQVDNSKISTGSDVLIKMKSLIDSLNQHGVSISKTAPDTYTDMKKLFLGTFASMMSENQPWLLRKFIAMDFKKLDDGSESFDAFFDAMNDNSDEKWEQLMNNRTELNKIWETFFSQYDFFICPITYGPAIVKCPQGSILPGDQGDMPYMDYFAYSYIFNATGHPCVTIPLGLNEKGLPIAIQVVTSYYNEDELLHFVKLISSFTPGFVQPIK